MGSFRQAVRNRPPLPPAVRAILWLDAVLVVAAALALFGLQPDLARAGASPWLTLVFSGLTAALAALAAFQVSLPGAHRAWMWLPVPPLVLWIGASALGCLAGAGTWGDTLAEAGRCLTFLIAVSAPLLALILFMLRRAAPRMRARAMALGGLAAAGAAASLLELVHSHQAAPFDLGVHSAAIGAVLVVSVLVAHAHRLK